MDAKHASTNSDLNETVHMCQPEGFIDPEFPDHVCKLNKALYGLKQAAGEFYQRISTFLQIMGFTCTKSDQVIFYRTISAVTARIIVYVDDILVITTNWDAL